MNTIDAGPPSSRVEPLPSSANERIFTVNWSGADDANGISGSGIASFDINVSRDGEPFTLWLDDVPATQTSAAFNGTVDHTYAFYSVATDNVGHVEPIPAIADASTTVVLEPGDYDRDGIVEADDRFG